MRPESLSTNRVIILAAVLLLASCNPGPGSTANEVKGPAQNVQGTCPAGMVFFPAATFKMGTTDADENAMPDDMPQHAVTVAAFCMAKMETTVEEYEACVKAGSCTAAEPDNKKTESLDKNFCNTGVSDRSNHPINCVDFEQATAYCNAQGARLPTEEEWEYAARGAAGRKYPWGSATPDTTRVNGCDLKCAMLGLKIDMLSGDAEDGWTTTAPIGSFPKGATPEGLQDMGGNVAEWTSSRECPYPQKSCAEEKRITRGGGWDSGFYETFSAYGRAAGGRDPRQRPSGVGIRCVKTPS
jgi:formylglycine-generating enzyme required for sulfatase activity